MCENKAGTTLVSVIVSFAMLMIVMAIFSQMVHVSLNLSKKTDEIIQGTQAAVNSYYTGEAQMPEESTSVSYTPKSGDGSSSESVGINYNGIKGKDGKAIYYFVTP